MTNNKILITGSAGFIGFHLVDLLLKENFEIIGLDIINDYYDVNLKKSRLVNHGINANELLEKTLTPSNKFINYKFIKADIADFNFIVDFIKSEKFDYIVNLAAQAGVRYSIENPQAYTHSNINGFLSILEGCRIAKVKHLIYASSSSVYGLNSKLPFSEKDLTEHPLALYGATKKANELMAHSYSNLFSIPTTGLRFFTVYGPWGRPDMALFLFTESIIKGEYINVFNNGQMIRDFTYVIDVVESIKRLISKPPIYNDKWDSFKPEIDSSSAPYTIFNIGNSDPILITEYISSLENALNKKAKINYLPLQQGDVIATHSDSTKLENYINYKPSTQIADGINNFANWYKKYYNIL